MLQVLILKSLRAVKQRKCPVFRKLQIEGLGGKAEHASESRNANQELSVPGYEAQYYLKSIVRW